MIPQEYRHLLGDLDQDQQDEIFASKTPEEQAQLLAELAEMQAQYEEEHGVGLTSGEKFNKEMLDPWTAPEDDDNWLQAGGKFLGETFLGSPIRTVSHGFDKIDDWFLDNADGVKSESGLGNAADLAFSIPLAGGVMSGVKGGVGLGGKSLGALKGPGEKILKWMGFGPRGSYKASTPGWSKFKRGAGFATTTLPASYAAYKAGFDGGPDLDNPDGGANATVVDPQDGEKKRAIWMDRDGDGVNDADQPGGPWGGNGPAPGAMQGGAPGGAGRPPGNPIMDQRMAQWMGARDYLSNMNRPSVLNEFTGKGPLDPIDAAMGKEAPDLDMAALLNYNGTLDQDNKKGVHYSMSHPINVKDVTRRGADNKRGTARELKSSLQESMDIRNAIAHGNLMENRHKVTEGYEGAYRNWAQNNPNVKLDWDGSGKDRMRFVREIYPNLHKYNQSPPEEKDLAPKMPDLDNPGGEEEDGDGISPWWLAPLAIPAYFGAKKLFGRKKAGEIAGKMMGGSKSGGGLKVTRPNSGSGGSINISRPGSGSGGGGVSSPVSGPSGGGGVATPRRNPRTFGEGLSGPSGGGGVATPRGLSRSDRVAGELYRMERAAGVDPRVVSAQASGMMRPGDAIPRAWGNPRDPSFFGQGLGARNPIPGHKPATFPPPALDDVADAGTRYMLGPRRLKQWPPQNRQLPGQSTLDHFGMTIDDVMRGLPGY